ncbi:glucosamine-6-phosphate deaminase [Sinomonas humi]|uniref:Glucosamine-6-phosphate deaminase n=1 Tax=Sinomonas humi TaxID=1338436 RepID=A0A0B2ANL6_9MICC|nr:glucosamine-6-phosphate deaminase [Sinomonas humi]KHL05271.1 glucosamine-6-phosphate deaminase [Sinomonas humi]
MEVVIHPDSGAVARTTADIVQGRLEQGHAALGLATGSTPLGAYRELIRRHRQEGLSFARAQAFTLDEYLGLPPEHLGSYRSVIRREFTDSVDFPDRAVHSLDGHAPDPVAEAARYEAAIAAAGGIDVQILGIGTDGHIGFNEPMSSLASRTRIKTLTEQTRRDNARFFPAPEDVPHHVLTQGLATIRDARHLLLIGLGEAKAEAIAAAVEGPLAAACPASSLQLHPHTTVLVDQAAASRLQHREYYEYTLAQKPDWQAY